MRAEQRAEHAGRVDARNAHPVDRAAGRDERGGLAVGQESVVADRDAGRLARAGGVGGGRVGVSIHPASMEHAAVSLQAGDQLGPSVSPGADRQPRPVRSRSGRARPGRAGRPPRSRPARNGWPWRSRRRPSRSDGPEPPAPPAAADPHGGEPDQHRPARHVPTASPRASRRRSRRTPTGRIAAPGRRTRTAGSSRGGATGISWISRQTGGQQDDRQPQPGIGVAMAQENPEQQGAEGGEVHRRVVEVAELAEPAVRQHPALDVEFAGQVHTRARTARSSEPGRNAPFAPDTESVPASCQSA